MGWRELVRTWEMCWLAAAMVPMAATSCAAEAPSRNAPAAQPNVIWIVADDLGYGDLGCYGSPDIATPWIDSLATEGTRFTDYCVYPVCTPTRASLLTGGYAHQAGIRGVLMGEGAMRRDLPTIGDRFKTQGYATGCVGKWHLGYEDADTPNARGFDYFFGFRGGKIDFFLHTDSAQKVEGKPLGKHDLWENWTEIHRDGEYSTTLFTDAADQFIRNHAAEPFFLYLAYNAPHYARPKVLQAPPEAIAKVARDPQHPTEREIYTAMVQCMDDGVGQVLATLRELGIDERTLVIFMSDNGADPGNGGSNTPLRGTKWTNWEGGIRVPMIARFPGRIPAGRTNPAMIHCMDLPWTSLAAAQIPLPAEAPGDAGALWPVMQGTASPPDRVLGWPAARGGVALRQGPWKWLLQNEKGKTEAFLYDLDRDLAEQHNLAAQQPERVNQLGQAWEAWARQTQLKK